MAKSVYNDQLVTALQSQDSWTYAEAVAFSVEHGLKVRSVIAKIKSLELVYVPKPVVTKTGEPVIRKSEIIADIETALKVSEGTLAGLQKATKGALQAVLAATASDAE